jgi:hypothetical protein
MAMVPYAEEAWTGLTPQQKAVIMGYAYKEAKSGAKGLSKLLLGGYGRKQRKKRRNGNGNGSNAQRQIVAYRPAPAKMPPKSSVPRALQYNRQVSAPNALATSIQQSYSSVLSTYKIVHREFLADIAGSVDYSVFGLRINPADPISFPWLARIARNYEYYQFKRLSYSLKTQTSTTTVGTVIVGIDYDPTDSLPLNKEDFLKFADVTRTAPWMDVNLSAKQKEMNDRKLYVAPIQASDDATQRLNDFGTLIVATKGQTSTLPTHELWVEYEVVFSVPQSAISCADQIQTSNSSIFFNGTAKTSRSSLGDILVPESNIVTGGRFGVFATGTFVVVISLSSFTTLPSDMTLDINGVAKTASLPFSTAGTTSGVRVWVLKLIKGQILDFAYVGGVALGAFGVITVTANEVEPSLYAGIAQ